MCMAKQFHSYHYRNFLASQKVFFLLDFETWLWGFVHQTSNVTKDKSYCHSKGLSV